MGELAIKIASKFHEDWRELQGEKDGLYTPKWKEIKDDYFVEQINLIKLKSRNSRVHDEAVKALNDFAGGEYPFADAMVDGEFVDKIYHLRLSNRLVLTDDGVYKLDIANCSFEELTADFQEENLLVAEIIERVIVKENKTGVRLKDDAVGKVIHNEYLVKNKNVKGTSFDVEFEKLSKEDQSKYVDQYKIGRQMEKELNKEIENGLEI